MTPTTRLTPKASPSPSHVESVVVRQVVETVPTSGHPSLDTSSDTPSDHHIIDGSSVRVTLDDGTPEDTGFLIVRNTLTLTSPDPKEISPSNKGVPTSVLLIRGTLGYPTSSPLPS